MKRTMDLCISIVLFLLVCLPLVIAATIFFFLYHENPIYLSKRAGKDGKAFCIFKLKSMRTLVDSDGKLLEDAKRLTRYGKLIRKLSIDELPQLVNVISGSMSLIGPRPLLLEYNELYTPSQKKRLLVKPGITGLAQINGRNAISWEKKFELDSEYVQKQSIKLDVEILFLTIVKVVKQENISQMNYVTMKKFNGSSRKLNEKDNGLGND
ncbi:sugar transferase [Carnobacterium maltaromaticum]|uniref:sugar transferase n=1 Tax=Carnobacterium maltaromaticum TaxID=2751 RepID=UPI00191B9316|nr:sugar transferase [Carnobacterium maltaromaticum]